MDNVITVLGIEEIDGNQFTGIEGGFGEGKRSMLVRDIAEAMHLSVKRLNELINKKENRKRFKDDVEIIDLKSKVDANDLTKEFGFSDHSVRMSNNIYLLSERGYAKLLKIMDSDEAWNQYDKFVDGYFQYREVVRETKNPLSLPEKIKAIAEGYGDIHEEVETIKDDVNDLKENFGLPGGKRRSLLNARSKQVITLLGGHDSNAYSQISRKVFARMGHDFKERFGVARYEDVPLSRFDEAMEYTKHWQLPTNLALDVRDLNSQTELEMEA